MIKLQDLEHFRNNPMVQFKEETVGGVEVVIPHYMIANDELWKQPLATELRGHVFRKDTGECISMAFHKFFNINEKEETLESNIDWAQDFVVQEKVDGSLVTSVLIDGEVYFKTKKSFYSDVAKLANQHATQEIISLVKLCIGENLHTPIFEFTHPDWKIVIDYGEQPTWKLLAIRSNISGKYVGIEALEFFPIATGVDLAKTYKFKNYQEIKDSINTLEGMEGYVITFADGSKYKTKCNWYTNRHLVRTNMTERDIARIINQSFGK